MDERHQKKTQIFQDTLCFCREHPVLAKAVEASKAATVLYREDELPSVPRAEKHEGRISVTTERSFEAAMRLSREHPGKRIAVLNFASAVTPGGGVLGGSSAQEESLCRCSTLYPCLNQEWLLADYYLKNRLTDNRTNTDAVIFSPDIRIIKSDVDLPERLPEAEWGCVDVITCAAPDFRLGTPSYIDPQTGKHIWLTWEYLTAVHERRARHILSAAAAHGDEFIVLGAFGCGAFANDPVPVAEAYRNVLKEFSGVFEEAVFAIFCADYETENYISFRTVLSEKLD